jgi:hypothetical protein
MKGRALGKGRQVMARGCLRSCKHSMITSRPGSTSIGKQPCVTPRGVAHCIQHNTAGPSMQDQAVSGNTPIVGAGGGEGLAGGLGGGSATSCASAAPRRVAPDPAWNAFSTWFT